ncbi:MAG: DUF1275 domain-containing protein [Acholeplasmatales bacterium]|nr:DUF1275 domain-containing protein [Acholeplasmatales bacterium]
MDKKVLLLWMCILTCLAGAINAIAIFGYDGTTVSHITGLVSKVAINLSNGDFSGLWDVLRIILAFFLGAIISGFVTGERAFYLHKRYGFIIIAIGVLIVVPYFLNVKYSVLLFSFIMGLQNGMVVSFKGVVVRMTHMSGNITDLGVYLGYKLRGNKNEKYITGLIPFIAIVSFILGGVIGVLLYGAIHNVIFFITSGIYIALGGIYFILRYRCKDKDFNGIPDELEKEEVKNE